MQATARCTCCEHARRARDTSGVLGSLLASLHRQHSDARVHVVISACIQVQGCRLSQQVQEAGFWKQGSGRRVQEGGFKKEGSGRRVQEGGSWPGAVFNKVGLGKKQHSGRGLRGRIQDEVLIRLCPFTLAVRARACTGIPSACACNNHQ
eukprot:76883-Chlamydomonas_euryale.AAC.1